MTQIAQHDQKDPKWPKTAQHNQNTQKYFENIFLCFSINVLFIVKQIHFTYNRNQFEH